MSSPIGVILEPILVILLIMFVTVCITAPNQVGKFFRDCWEWLKNSWKIK